MPDGEHQFVNLTLAGARSPRVASKQGETSEPWGDEVSHCASNIYRVDTNFQIMQAKYFTESRILQRAVKVQPLSLPTVTATPFQTNGSSAPAPASIFIATGQLLWSALGFLFLGLRGLSSQSSTRWAILQNSFSQLGLRTWWNGTQGC